MTPANGDRMRDEAGGREDEWALLPWLDGPLRQGVAMTRSHAMLAYGSLGVGQLGFALALGRALLCEAISAQRPCAICASCRLARAHANPDFQVVVPDAVREALGWPGRESGSTSDAKPSRDIRIAQVRAAIAWGQQTPARGGVKVLVIHPADALNDAAASALLKTLEEPPPSLRIVLTGTDPERLLPTVRSRCQLVRLPLPDGQTATAWLQMRGVGAAQTLLRLAAGSPLEAVAMAGEGIDAAFVDELPRRVAAGDASSLVGRPVPRVLDLLLKLSHDHARRAVGGEPCFYPADALARPPEPKALADWQRELLRVARQADHPWHAPLLIEALVAAGSRAVRGPLHSMS